MKSIFNSFIYTLLVVLTASQMMLASSHREAPLIAADPQADNTDVYAFRSPDNPDMITIISNFIPMELPHGGPNYYNFGENIYYEIHIDNDASNPGDEITYRFSFTIVNEDPTTFFNIRLGQQNQKATYELQKSIDGGQTWSTIVEGGVVPPNNIGARSIEGMAGLNTTYDQLFNGAIMNATTGERVFAGPVDDPFFVDLGGIFDLGDSPRQNGEPRDGLACYNVHSLAIQVPITSLLKDGAASTPANILDSDYIIGVWSSASRPRIRTLSAGMEDYSGDFVQVSRLGMPLTNEVVIPIGQKDFWNSITPYDEFTETTLDQYFYNPELALYISPGPFADAVPAFSQLSIQSNSLGMFDFSNGADGLFALKGTAALDGTALSEDAFGGVLLPGPGVPRSVDLWPIFHTGAPNLPPYQLATGKGGNPLAAGKPFINNFLPNGGDMLRLNMAVPPTPRDDANFSSLGLVQAAVLGLTDPTYANPDLQFIPNMDGFPNGRRLEDDVTRIEIQAVSGIVLAAIGLWYDDFDGTNPVSDDLVGVLTYSTGVEMNDVPFQSAFPYMALPRRGTGECSGLIYDPDASTPPPNANTVDLELDVKANKLRYKQYETVTFTVTVTNKGPLDASNVMVNAGLPNGLVFTSVNPSKGSYELFFEKWTVGNLAAGETATLDLTLFTLVNDRDVTFFTQVMTASPDDSDSTPGNDNDQTPDEDDEAAVTITPFNSGGFNTNDGSADLSLSIEVDDNTYEIYETVAYTLTLTNDGPDVATNINVSAGLPDGMVYTSDNPSTGVYNLFFERWSIPSLASGESATLELVLFTLVDNQPITQFVQVTVTDQPDPDSTPGNNAGTTPNEDDEAAVTITSDDNAIANRNREYNLPANIPFVVDQLFPVPVESTLNATFYSQHEMPAQINVYNLNGERIYYRNVNLNKGYNELQFDLSGLPQGMYLLDIPVNDEYRLKKKFVKAGRS